MIGRIVYSAAGRDRGRLMVIVGETENHLLVCDGQERRLERPKRKNPKHLCFTSRHLEAEQLVTNRRLKKELKKYSCCFVEEENKCQNRI